MCLRTLPSIAPIGPVCLKGASVQFETLTARLGSAVGVCSAALKTCDGPPLDAVRTVRAPRSWLTTDTGQRAYPRGNALGPPRLAAVPSGPPHPVPQRESNRDRYRESSEFGPAQDRDSGG